MKFGHPNLQTGNRKIKEVSHLINVLFLVLLIGCSHSETGKIKKTDNSHPFNGEADILQSWQGDFPVAQLELLPDNQRKQAVGFSDDAETFEAVWRVFKPDKAVPEINFKANLVLFACNTQFFNRISIRRVNVKNGVAEVLAMETMSAMPIEYKVAMSLVKVIRQGITTLQSDNGMHQIIFLKSSS